MATGETVLVQLGDGITSPFVTIKITDNGDTTFKFEVAQSGPVVGDLQGIFFDVGGGNDVELGAASNQTSILALNATGTGVTNLVSTILDGNDSVTNLGGGVNMNGALSFNDIGAEAKGYDVGIGFGTSGIGKDDVRSVSFTFANTAGLTINDFVGMDFGVRMTSVGTEGGSREGSVKLTSMSFQPVTDANEDINCVLEDSIATGDVLADSTTTNGGAVSVTQVLTGFTIDLDGDNNIGTGESFTFDALTTSHTVALGTTGATLTLHSDGTYQIDANGSDALNDGDHLPFKVTYNVHQTYTHDSNGHEIGQLSETSTLDFDICGVDNDGGGDPTPPTDATAFSHGYWKSHDFGGSEGFAAGVNGKTFDDFFNLDTPGERTWTDQTGANNLALQDLTFERAVDFGNGSGNAGDTTTPTVGGPFEDLVREAATAVLNFYDSDNSASFVDWYVYERNLTDNDGIAGNNPTDAASALADLKAQVDATLSGDADAYSVADLANLLHATHHA